MNIALKMGRVIAMPLLFAGFMANVGHAQTLSVTKVNGKDCTSAQPVSINYERGTLTIQTSGCGTTELSTSTQPKIISVTPQAAPVKSPVTITGTGLSGAIVKIGGFIASSITNTNIITGIDTISTSVPSDANVGPTNVEVKTSNGLTDSKPFTVEKTPVGGSDVSLEGVTLPNPSKYAYIVPAIRVGANGAGPDVNAYAMPGAANCNTTPALTKSWQHIIDLANYRSQNAIEYFVMQAGESLSYKFTAPMVDASGGFAYNDAANAAIRPTFMTVTPDRCNYDKTKLNTAIFNGCFKTATSGNSVIWTTLDPSVFAPAAYCRLTKGQTYYFNLRFQDARPVEQGGTPNSDSCIGGNCGGVLQIN